MMYALQAEGEYERFSRNNRASAQKDQIVGCSGAGNKDPEEYNR